MALFCIDNLRMETIYIMDFYKIKLYLLIRDNVYFNDSFVQF